MAAKTLTKEQANLASSMLGTATAEGTAAAGANSLSLAFKGLWATVLAHPFVAAAAAIAAVAVAVGRYKEKQHEANQEIINTGKQVANDAKTSREAYNNLTELFDSYKLGQATKDELKDVTDKYIESLGSERWQVQGLKDDYSNLIEVMNGLKANKLTGDRGALIKAIEAARKDVVASASLISSSSTLFTSLSGWFDKYNTPEQLELMDLFVEEVQNGESELGKKLDLQRDSEGNYILAFKGEFSGEDGVVNLVAAARDVKDELLKIANDEGIGDSLYENWVYKYADNIEKTLGSYADNITDAERNLAQNIAESYYSNFMANGGEIPKTIDEYYALRDGMIAAVKGSDTLKDSALDAAGAVDSLLSSYSFSSEFTSGFGKFKHELIKLMSSVEYSTSSVDKQKDMLKAWAKEMGYTESELAGYVAQWENELKDAGSNITLDNIADLATLRDELAKTSKAWEEYNKILEGGDRGDEANKMAQAYRKAIDDIEKGRIDTKAVWGAAKLIFSDEQLANMKYDLTRIAKELSGPMMKALFGADEDDDTEIGVKFANYIKEHAAQLEKAGAHILDTGNGTFRFWYDNLEELAKGLGMSEEAVISLLDALDAYGVQSMRSGEDTAKLAEDYKAIYNTITDAGDAAERTAKAVKEFIRQMFTDGMNEHEILDVLKNLSDRGIIAQDVDQLSAAIAGTVKELETVGETNPTPTIDADTSPANTAIDNLYSRLNALAATTTVTTVQVRTVEEAGTVSRPSSTRVAPGTRTPGGRSSASGTRDAAGGPTLVNELGPELISDNGVAYIANGGKPGFTDLGKGAIVFTADETKKIFSGSFSDIPVRALADGTTNRAALRDRLINGEKVRGLYTGGISKKFPCVKCGYSWNYSPIDYPKGPTAACPKCGAVYVDGQYQPEYGYTAVNQKHADDEYYPFSSSTGQPISGSYERNIEKSCPNCGATVSLNTMVCPSCQYNFRTGTAPSKISSKPVASYQDVKIPANTKSDDDGGSSGYTGSGGGTGVGSADYASQAEPQKVDWIAVLLNRIQRKVADLEKIASSGFKSLSTRLSAAADEVAEVNKEIEKQRKAYDRYMEEAEGVGLSTDLQKLVQDGTIDIREYEEDTRELIDKYSEWYEKALDAKSAVEELSQEVADLFVDMFNATQTDFDNQLSMIEHKTSMIEKNISEASARGYLDSAEYYKRLIELENDNIAKLEEELPALQKKFQDAMDSGQIEEYSEAWYGMQQSIQSVEEAIADARISLLEYEKTMRSIKWNYFDYALNTFGQLQQEANFLIGLLSNDKLFDDTGRFAEKGTATMGLRVMNYNAYMRQAEEYASEMQRISEALAETPYDTELIERRRTLLGLQQQSIQAAESEKDAMRDLVSQGIQAELSALKDLIDAYEDSLDSAKSLYDYQKKISEKTGDVAKLQKQLAAYQGDNSEENRARVQKLQEELRKAQEDLEETEWEHNISDQKKLLSELYDEYETYMNERLDNIETLVQEMVDGVNNNAELIMDELSNSAARVGYTITDGMQGVLANGVYSYYDQMFTSVTGINDYLADISRMMAEMIGESDRAAKESIYGTPEASGQNLDYDFAGIKVRQNIDGDTVTWTDQSNKNNSPLQMDLTTYSGSVRSGLIRDMLYDWLRSAHGELSQSDLDELFRRITDDLNIMPYAKGGLADYTGPAILHGTKARPELVLNADDTERFMAAAKLMRTPTFDALINRSGDIGSILSQTGQAGNGDVYFGDLNFQIDHVQDYNDLVAQMRDDPKFEKLVSAITFDRMSGKSSFGGKNRIRF